MMNYSEFKSAAAKIVTLETAIAEGYRALQAQLKAFQEAKIVTLQVKLNASFAVLKAEAQRLIDGYRPIAETQDATPTATVEQKINEVLTSLPTDTIVDNSDFGDRINTGNADEKIWLVNKDKNGAGVTFVKTECGRYYETYAGDALRSIALLGMPTFIWAGVLKTQVAVPDAIRLQEDAQKLGLTFHLYDRTTDTDTHQDATATKTATATEAEIYKQEFEAVVAALPVYTVITNRDFEIRKHLGEFGVSSGSVTVEQIHWLEKKEGNESNIVIFKPSNLSAISYAGDALRLIAILGTRPLVENGALKTHIPMLDLEGVLHKAKKQGFNIKVSDADQTVILHKPK